MFPFPLPFPSLFKSNSHSRGNSRNPMHTSKCDAKENNTRPLIVTGGRILDWLIRRIYVGGLHETRLLQKCNNLELVAYVQKTNQNLVKCHVKMYTLSLYSSC